MIVGAKEVFWKEDFSKVMDGAQMSLLTVADGKIYFEQSPYVEHTVSSIN